MASETERPKATSPIDLGDSDVARRLERRRARREQRNGRTQQGEGGEAKVATPRPQREPREPRRTPRADSSFEGEQAPIVRRPSSGGPTPARMSVRFDKELINADAAKVVQRLTRQGHEAYLVGGCVRDLLVGQRPKDFDVATSARPEEVRSLFRNSRVIGRRFRLVHVLFGGNHIVETATFRKNPLPATDGDADDLLIRSDNVFGEAHEDALRRDFTINALFYDLEDGSVLDWVGGMAHIDSRTVHTIGDPLVRFQEDPVRILRAIKFAARIDFGMTPEVYEAIVQCRGALAMAARPRLSEEVLRLMRGGASHRSMWLCWETGVLDMLLPELSSYLADAADDDSVWRLLSEVDRRTKADEKPLDDVLLWAALLLEPLSEACAFGSDPARGANDFLEPVVERLNLPRRIADSVRRIVALLPRIEQGRGDRYRKNPLYALTEELADLRRAARVEKPLPLTAVTEGRAKRKRRKKPGKIPKD